MFFNEDPTQKGNNFIFSLIDFSHTLLKIHFSNFPLPLQNRINLLLIEVPFTLLKVSLKRFYFFLTNIILIYNKIVL